MQGIILTTVDRIPVRCLEWEMHDDVLWCPYAGEYVEIYAKVKERNPRCPIKDDEQEISDGKQDI